MSQLNATKRDIFGKALAVARKNGQLPAVLYGGKEKPISIFLETREFNKVLGIAGETTVISLKVESVGGKDVLIHQVDIDPIRNIPIHVDFYAIDKDKKIKIGVPLEFTGTALAVKDLGGTLVKVLHELEIEALPKNIPHHIEVDISPLLTLESNISVKDIKLPEGVTATHEPEEIAAAVSVAKEEAPEPVVMPDLSTIEVEKKGKKEEEGGGDEEEAPSGGKEKNEK